jgi:uncharacterized protein YbgA (DUF1722 family)/uncharacterized protein YbbK (DUF523 family)
MNQFIKPVVVVSRCLGFDACRINGDIIQDQFLNTLREYVEVITVCPEADIGLGTPRNPVRLVESKQQGVRLVQPVTGKDITDSMKHYAETFIEKIDKPIDGYILKSRSPTCGIKDSKIYSEKGMVTGKTAGVFARKIVDSQKHLAIMDEGRLKNYLLRESFLTKLFLLATFRERKEQKSIQALVQFQSENKYLFMAYHQQKQKELGRIVSNGENQSLENIFDLYEQKLHELLEHSRSVKANINVMHHILGHFSKQLLPEEKTFLLTLIEKYREKRIPLSNPLMVLNSWAVRFKANYLLDQTIFQPYPEQLNDLTDSGKGRDY